MEMSEMLGFICEIITMLVSENIVKNVLCIYCSDFAKIFYAQKETIFMEI